MAEFALMGIYDSRLLHLKKIIFYVLWALEILKQPTLKVYQFTVYWTATSALAALLFILLALWPIRTGFALSEFVFLAYFWLNNVLLCLVSSGGRISSRYNWEAANVALATQREKSASFYMTN
jgi:hypothetical protein